ncbi:hypothetical protein [Nocardiopsis potens]|uniref:hypothetical protein n=1 Tax=Nocardiopsis potens TaxID=1246458 RepID=UPI00034CEB03|nr:hypothetical protein [Nocardiopsis potens]
MDETMRTRSRKNPALPLAGGIALLAGAAPAAWWAARTSPEEAAARHGHPLGEAEYAVEPLPLPDWAVHAAGLGGAAVALAAAALLAWGISTGRIERVWGPVLVCLLPLPVMAGLWWAIATAPVIGANIGLGLATWAFPPLAAVFLATAATIAVLSRRRRAGRTAS